MIYIKSCITMTSRATHLFGLSDGHSFTIETDTHTQTRAHVSKPMGAVQDWAGGTGNAGVPTLPQGVGVMARPCHW